MDADGDEPYPKGQATRELTAIRPFYRSLPRQRLTFVPASRGGHAEDGLSGPLSDAAGVYESIVLKHRQHPSGAPDEPAHPEISGSNPRAASAPPTTRRSSESADSTPATVRDPRATLAHQVGLEHSHPPSHLDRTGKGFQYLASYGWDADARLGLGPAGEGMRAPLKAVEKKDTMGLGLRLAKNEAPPKQPRLLDAGKVRKQQARDRKHDARLRDMIFGDGRLERYLGESGNPGAARPP